VENTSKNVSIQGDKYNVNDHHQAKDISKFAKIKSEDTFTVRRSLRNPNGFYSHLQWVMMTPKKAQMVLKTRRHKNKRVQVPLEWKVNGIEINHFKTT
jgi:hypothetical protein